VVAALLAKERLLEKAGCEIPTLIAENSPLGTQSYNPPKYVETQTSSVKRGQEYIVTASGGVQIASWQALENMEDRPAVAEVRNRAKPRHDRTAWWNANR
jgi:hypothetical protein